MKDTIVIPWDHYFHRYITICQHYKDNPPTDRFCETHHMIPKSWGGTNDADNLITMPAQAHYICHYLLHKMNPADKKLAHAFAMMAVDSPKTSRKMRGKLYEAARKARSEAMTGVPRSEETKAKLRKPKKNTENYKKPKSPEHRANISKALKGKKKSPEHIAAFTKSRWGDKN